MASFVIMRLFEFVRCGGGGGRRGALLHDPDDFDASVPTEVAPRKEEEAAAPLACASGGEKRRGRLGAGAAGSGGWRPSLGAISEEGQEVKSKIGNRRIERPQQPATAKVKMAPTRAMAKEVRSAPRSDREHFR